MILALLTGRGGSSYKNKNILKINNKPILGYPCSAAKKVKKIKYFYASSNDLKILANAKKFGFNSIKRPEKYSRATSKHYDVLIHAIKKLKSKKIYPEIIVVLLANAPIISSKWINECINLLIKKKASAVVPVMKDSDKHPFRAKKKINGVLLPFFNSSKRISSNRQDLQPSYFLCHNFWVIKTEAIIKNNGLPPWNFMGKKVLPYEISHSHDIHNKFDMEVCKIILKKFS